MFIMYISGKHEVLGLLCYRSVAMTKRSCQHVTSPTSQATFTYNHCLPFPACKFAFGCATRTSVLCRFSVPCRASSRCWIRRRSMVSRVLKHDEMFAPLCKARFEQDEESLRKHRQFDTPFALLPKVGKLYAVLCMCTSARCTR